MTGVAGAWSTVRVHQTSRMMPTHTTSISPSRTAKTASENTSARACRYCPYQRCQAVAGWASPPGCTTRTAARRRSRAAMSRHTAGQWCARVVLPSEGWVCTSEMPEPLLVARAATLRKPTCKTANAWLLDKGQAAGTCLKWCNKHLPVSLSYSSCTLSCLCRSLSARGWSPLQTTMAKVAVRVLRMACSHGSQSGTGTPLHTSGGPVAP